MTKTILSILRNSLNFKIGTLYLYFYDYNIYIYYYTYKFKSGTI